MNDNLKKHIKYSIGKTDNFGNEMTGNEDWLVVTFLGTKRSFNLDKNERFTTAFTAGTQDEAYCIRDIFDLIAFINERTAMTGDVIIEMLYYKDGELKEDIVHDALHHDAAQLGIPMMIGNHDGCWELYQNVSGMFGIFNMDPADFAEEFWYTHAYS